MQAVSPSNPHTNPKGAATGSGVPIGSRKTTPKSKASPIPDEPVEPPRTPMPGQFEGGGDGDEEDKHESKPAALDEAIDLGDEDKSAGEEEEQTNEGAPFGTEQTSEVEQASEKGVEEASSEIEQTGEQDHEEAPSEIEQTGEQDHEEAPSEIEQAGEQGHEEAPSEIEQSPSEIEEAGEKGTEQATSEIEQSPSEIEQSGEKGIEEAPSEVEQTGEEATEEPATDTPNFAILEGCKVNKGGLIVNEKGNPVGKLVEGDPKKLAGKTVSKDGKIWNDSGKVIGQAEPIPEEEREPASVAPFEDFPDAVVDASGKILFENRKIGVVTEGNPRELAGKKVDQDGDILDKHGNVIGKAIREDEEEPEPEEEPVAEKIDCSALAGLRVNKAGNIISENGKTLLGRVVEGALKSLIGKTCDGDGNIHNDVGKVIGRAEPIPDNEKEERVETPFEDFPNSIVTKTGDIVFEGKVIGKVIEGDAKVLAGKTVDPEGDIVDKYGTVLGKAQRWEEEEVPEEEIDMSILAGKRVNKAGNVVDSSGTIYGRLVEGDIKSLAGRMCDKQGFVRNEAGDVVGKAELVPEGDREGLKEGPFADFPGCTVGKDGKISFDDVVIGRLVEGDSKKLFGKAVDDDGDVVDKNGNVLGKAERWEEEEEEKDVNPMSGLKVNKQGEVYDSSGEIIGKLTEGLVDRCAGLKIDDAGDVLDSKGNTIGHVTLIQDIPPEPEKTDVNPMSGLKVNKQGEVYDSSGELIGKLTEGLVGRCAGQKIDDSGDVVDSKGNAIGHVTLVQDIPPEPEKTDVNPMSGLKVNKKGEVYNKDGDLIGKVTDGVIGTCAGRTINDEGDVCDQKGNVIGHVTLLEDIEEEEPEPEPETETEEEKAKRLQAEEDKKLAIRMSTCIQQSLERIHPVLKMITEVIDKAERLPKEELDEQKVVDEVKPLLEEGGRILQEANGVLRGLDPDGRIAANAKHKTAAREATPEEYHLADLLKELTGNVTQTIDNAKKKIADMPHAKKELNPLWGLLTEPLFQILAAVGLLLSGVLGLVGQLLNGLGLGGLVHGLLGGLGITRVLDGLGLGKLLAPITGSKKK